MLLICLGVMVLGHMTAADAHCQSTPKPKPQGTIKGRVLDGESLEPLIGATVYLDSTTFGCSTDTGGAFTIHSIPAGMYTLHVSYIGYQRYTHANVRIKGDSTCFFLIMMQSVRVWSSGDLHDAIQDEALHDADSLWENDLPILLSPLPVTVNEAWFADRYHFKFVYDTTHSILYRNTFNGKINELMGDRYGEIFANQLEALWRRNHPDR